MEQKNNKRGGSKRVLLEMSMGLNDVLEGDDGDADDEVAAFFGTADFSSDDEPEEVKPATKSTKTVSFNLAEPESLSGQDF